MSRSFTARYFVMVISASMSNTLNIGFCILFVEVHWSWNIYIYIYEYDAANYLQNNNVSPKQKNMEASRIFWKELQRSTHEDLIHHFPKKWLVVPSTWYIHRFVLNLSNWKQNNKKITKQSTNDRKWRPGNLRKGCVYLGFRHWWYRKCFDSQIRPEPKMI